MLKKRLLAAEDFQEKAGVDDSPGKENLITLPVLSFSRTNNYSTVYELPRKDL